MTVRALTLVPAVGAAALLLGAASARADTTLATGLPADVTVSMRGDAIAWSAPAGGGRWKLVIARRGVAAEARELVAQMLALVEETDLLDLRGDALLDAAETLRLLEDEEAAAHAERALALYRAKGNVVSARRAQELLAETVKA